MDKKDNKKYIKELYSKATKILYSYVLEVLKKYEYEGSPIYNEYIDRETLNQIIDRVLEKAGELDYIEEIILKEDISNIIDEKILLRALIELIIINELFVVSGDTEDSMEENDELKEDVRNEGMIYYIKLFEDKTENLLENESTEVKQYFGNFL